MLCDSIIFLALVSALTLNPITWACALAAKLISDSVMPPTAPVAYTHLRAHET